MKTSPGLCSVGCTAFVPCAVPGSLVDVPWWMLGGAAASQGTGTGGRPVPGPGCGGPRAGSSGRETEACGGLQLFVLLLCSVCEYYEKYLKSVNVEARGPTRQFNATQVMEYLPVLYKIGSQEPSLNGRDSVLSASPHRVDPVGHRCA